MPVDPDERPTATDERWDSGVGSRLGDTAPCVAMKYPRYVKATYGLVDRPLRASAAPARPRDRVLRRSSGSSRVVEGFGPRGAYPAIGACAARQVVRRS